MTKIVPPPENAPLNKAHPLARGLLEMARPVANGVRCTVSNTMAALTNGSNAASRGGLGRQHTTIYDITDIIDAAKLPTTACTVVVYMTRRGWPNAAPYPMLFANTAAADNTRLTSHCPDRGGLVAFDFGGYSDGSTRVSTASSNFVDGKPTLMVFTAGPRGMEIWQDGAIIASHSNPPTRSASTGTWGARGQYTNGADEAVTYHMLGIWSRQLNLAEVRALSQDPWQIFEPVKRTIPLVAPVAAAASDGNSVGTSTASAVGTATASASGASTSSGAATGVGQAIKAAAGSANAAGTASAASTSIVTAAGASSGVGFAAAVGLRTASAVGNSVATGAASGVGVVAGSVGASVASGAASGVGLSTAAAPGIGSASSTASASGQSIATGTGSSIATGSASAVGSVGGSQGSAAGAGTASAVGQSTVTAAGGSAATGAATGVGQSRVAGAGAANATSLASAVGSTGGSQGYSGAQSAASGVGQSYVTGVAMSAGFGVAVGAGSSIARAGGVSTATSTAEAAAGGIDLTVRADRMIAGFHRGRTITGFDRARIIGAA